MTNQNQECNNQEGSSEGWEIKLLEFLVRLMVPARVREQFVGDLLEEWSSCVVPQRGKLKGLFWLCSQLIRSLIPMASVRLRGQFVGGYAMFHRENIPKSVKMAAAANLVFAVWHFSSFVYLVSTMPLAWFGLVKMLFAIAGAIGLLKLSRGWRVFTVFISWLGVVFLPFYILATILSPEAFLNLFGMSGVSPAIVLSFEVFAFALFLFILICLTRPDAKRAFQSTVQQSGEQATLAS